MEPSRKPFVRTPPAAGALHTKGGLLLKREVVCRALTSHGDSEDRVGHHPEQEERQIDARELVTGPRVFDARRHQKLRGESKQHGPRDDRDSEIDRVKADVNTNAMLATATTVDEKVMALTDVRSSETEGSIGSPARR